MLTFVCIGKFNTGVYVTDARYQIVGLSLADFRRRHGTGQQLWQVIVEL
jgi:hypothetical protein